jgi:hypothetical protein
MTRLGARAVAIGLALGTMLGPAAEAGAGELPAAPGGGTTAPVSSEPIADPFVLSVFGTWTVYATNYTLTGINVPQFHSGDFFGWAWYGDALPRLPAWAAPGNTWAPGVLTTPSGLVLFFTARHRRSGDECIGLAIAPGLLALFEPVAEKPLVCQHRRNGSIDPNPFVDRNGVPYLLWKSEGVVDQEPTFLWSQQLTADGLELVAGTRSRLLATEQAWEGNVIENPAMVRKRGAYWLFYSGNEWNSRNSAIGVARCETPTGTCARVYSTPVLRSRSPMAGPGGPTILRGPEGRLRLGFAAWTDPDIGYDAGGQRRLHTLRLSFASGKPAVG